MERIKIYGETGTLSGMNGVGIFVRAFMDQFPRIPVEEEGRLHDSGLRENFIQNVLHMGGGFKNG